MSSTLSRLDGRAAVLAGGWRGVVNDYYELTKPRIIYLLLITTLAAMVMAARGLPRPELILVTLVGGAFAAASAGAFNCVIDRDIDRLMARTASRPVAAGRIAPLPALVFASVLGIVSFAMLYAFADPLAAWLSLAGNVYYVGIYTLWLKRSTALNIVIGGAAGAVPPLVGWAAVAHSLGGPAFGLFALVFLWTPPHFWALALMTNTDYARANVPMLPNVRGIPHTKIEILVYSIVLVVASVALTPLGIFGWWYFWPALVLGAIFLWDAARLMRGPTKPAARALFKYSLLYLALMCAAMVVDRVVAADAEPMSAAPARVAGHTFDRSNLPLLLTLGLGVFAGALDLGVLSPALPALAQTFHTPPRDVAWVFTLYLFANVIAIPVMAKLSDVYGRRSIYTLCVSIFAAGSLLAILAQSFPVFLTARAIQAIGAGGIFPVATAAIADRVPVERRGSALGMLGAIWGLAAIVGPNLGGVLTHYFSWHWIFAANVPLALVVIALAQRYVPTLAPQKRGPLDVAGIVFLGLGLLCVMIGLTRLDPSAASFGGTVTLAALPGAIVCFGVLVLIERRAIAPVIAPGLFATRQLAVTYGLELLIGLLEGALFFIPAALTAADRLNPAQAGAIAAVGALVFVAVIPLAGRALDAVGSRLVLTAGALLTAIGLALFGLWLTSLPLAIFAVAVAGVGFGALLGAPTRYIITNEAPPTLRATAVGILSVFLIIGQIVGGSLAGGVVGNDIANVAGYRAAYEAFAIIAVLAALGTGLLATRAQERHQPPAPSS